MTTRITFAIRFGHIVASFIIMIIILFERAASRLSERVCVSVAHYTQYREAIHPASSSGSSHHNE